MTVYLIFACVLQLLCVCPLSRSVFQLMDGDGDGELGFAEFVTFLLAIKDMEIDGLMKKGPSHQHSNKEVVQETSTSKSLGSQEAMLTAPTQLLPDVTSDPSVDLKLTVEDVVGNCARRIAHRFILESSHVGETVQSLENDLVHLIYHRLGGADEATKSGLGEHGRDNGRPSSTELSAPNQQSNIHFRQTSQLRNGAFQSAPNLIRYSVSHAPKTPPRDQRMRHSEANTSHPTRLKRRQSLPPQKRFHTKVSTSQPSSFGCSYARGPKEESTIHRGSWTTADRFHSNSLRAHAEGAVGNGGLSRRSSSSLDRPRDLGAASSPPGLRLREGAVELASAVEHSRATFAARWKSSSPGLEGP